MKSGGLLKVNEKTFSTEGINCIVADVQSEELAANETSSHKLNRFRDLILESPDEGVVDVEVLRGCVVTLR